MADEMNQNVAILSLVAALKDNTKELTASVKKQITQVEKNAGEINFTGNTEDVQKKLKEVVELLTKELKGVNVTRYLQPMLEVFSDSTKSAEEYLDAVDKVASSMRDLARIGSNAQGSVNKNIQTLLPSLNSREISRALTLQKKVEQQRLNSADKISKAEEKAKKVEEISLQKLRSIYKENEKYTSSINNDKVTDLISRMGIKSPTSDVKNEIKHYSELVSLFELLQQKKTDLGAIDTKEKALENVEITKTLLSLYKKIEEKRKMFAANSQYKVKDTTIGLPENYPKDDKELNAYKVLQANKSYVDAIEKETKKTILEAEAELSKYVTEHAAAYKEKSDQEFERTIAKEKKKFSVKSGENANTEEHIKGIENAANEAKDGVNALGDALGDLGDDKGGSDNELDLWAKSAENLKDQFADVIKYAVDAKAALEEIEKLAKEAEKSKGLDDDQQRDLIGYARRFDEINTDDDVFISDTANDWIEIYQDKYKLLIKNVAKMTNAQLEEIERLKVAQKEITEQPISSPSTSNVEKQVEETTEAIEKLAQAEKEARDGAEQLEENLISSLGASQNEISELIALVRDLANKLGSADFADNLVKNQNELTNAFKNIADEFGETLKENITEFADNLDSATKEEYNFETIRNELLSIVQQFQNSLQAVGLSSTQLDEAYKTIKGWSDADAYSSTKADITTGERGAFMNSKTGEISNSFFVDSTKSFGDVLFKAIKELSVGLDREISSVYDTWIHSHPFRKTIDNLKTVGSDIGFSVGDLELGVEKYIKEKIPNMLVSNNYKFTNLDLSDVSEEITKKFLKEYKKELLKSGLTEDLIDGKKKIVFPSKLAKHDGVFDLDLKSSILHNAMQNAMSTVGLDLSRLTTGNIEDLKVDLSEVYQEEQKVTQQGQELSYVVNGIVDALKELNQNNTLKFDGLDVLISNLEEVKTLLNEISNSLKGNINISSLLPNVEEIQQQVKETATVLSEVDQGYDLSSPIQPEVMSGEIDTELKSRIETIKKEKAILAKIREDNDFGDYGEEGSLSDEYYNDAINSIKAMDASYEDVLSTLTKIRDLQKEQHTLYGQMNGLNPFSEEHNDLQKMHESKSQQIRDLEESLSILGVFEDETDRVINKNMSDSDLETYAKDFVTYIAQAKLELGSMDDVQFANLIQSLSKIQTPIENTRQEIEQTTKELQKLGDVYRAVRNQELEFLDRNPDGTGAIWATSERDLYNTLYTGHNEGKEYSAEMYARNPLVIDAKSQDFNAITYLGDGADEASKQITELYNRIQELTKVREESFTSTGTETQEYIELSKQLGLAKTQYDELSKSRSNVYGTHFTDDFVELAKANGYDALKIENVYDSTNQLATTYAVWSDEQVKNIKLIASGEEELLRIHNELIQSNEVPIPSSTTSSTQDQTEQLDKLETKLQEVRIEAEKTEEAVEQVVEAPTLSPTPETKISEEVTNTKKLISDTSSIDAEKASLKELENAVSSVIEEIDKKTQAFHNEKAAVDMIIPSEIATLETLEGELIIIRELLEQLSKIPIDISFKTENLDENTQKVLDEIKTSLAGIDTSSLSNISTVLEGFKISKANVENLQKLANAILTLKSNLNNVSGQGQQFLSDIKELIAQADGLKDLATVLKATRSQIVNVKKDTKSPIDEDEEKVKELNDAYDELIGKLNKYNDLLNGEKSKTNKTSAYKNEINDIQEVISKLTNAHIDIIDESSIEKLKSSISEIENRMNSLKKDKKFDLVSDDEINNLLRQASKVYNKNTAAPKELREGVQSVIDKLETMKNELKEVDRIEFNKVKSELKDFEAQIEKTGKTGASFGDKIKKKFGDVAAYFATYVSIQDGLQALRQAYQYVADIDAQMIELEKVSNMSDGRLAESFEHAKDAAADLGSTVSDVIKATADWSRLGYDADAAEQLAEVSTIYKNVGDGIDIATANESLISTLQGFKMEASEAMDIVDSFNEVANRMPIDSAGIGEALQRSAASFNAANTDLNSAISLITATNAVVQDPTRVGNMWKTVSMRIRGAKAELEEAGLETEGMVNSTSELRDLIKGMTGFDIMLDDTTYKDMKEIIVGIGKEWDKLSDIDQAALLEKLAGKTQGNALAAALDNWEMIEETYAIAEESSGSAMREQEKWEQGLEARTNKLKASLETLSTTVLDSDFLGGAIDAGRGFIDILTEIIDNLGLIPTLLAGGGGIFAAIKTIQGNGMLKCRVS